MKKLVLITIVITGVVVGNYLYSKEPQIVSVDSAKASSERISERIRNMTLDEKIGQMMIIGFKSTYADDHVARMIREYHVGGVNLLRRNVVDAEQTRKLVSDLRKINASSTDVMFLVATDQEGGNYSRFTFLPYQKPETLLTSKEIAYEESLGRGSALRDLGIDVSFGPVVDYVTDRQSYLYGRTFGTTSDQIAGLAASMMRGYEESGIRTVVKHFPGYGNIIKDPHKYGASLDDRRIYEESLRPFRELLTGKKDGAVMTAHIIVSEIDAKPATFSEKFLSGMLRSEWGFEGVIISDDLEMASAGDVPVPQLAVEAIKAGNDMIISTFTPSLHQLIHEAIKDAVLDGYISEAQINRSVERILGYKGY